MDTVEILDQLQKRAGRDQEVREKLLAARREKDPLMAFCQVSRELGYELYPMELVCAGEEFYASMRRSTNGGGENSPMLEGEDDFYELFFAALENDKKPEGQGKILVSACLLGENCKYNGKNNYDRELCRFLEDKDVIAVCPEQLGGLPTPRTPVELKDGIAFNQRGENVQEYFQAGVKKVLQRIEGETIEYAILQARSPSCGVLEIYDGSFAGKKISGQGQLAQALGKKGIKTIDSSLWQQLKEKNL